MRRGVLKPYGGRRRRGAWMFYVRVALAILAAGFVVYREWHRGPVPRRGGGAVREARVRVAVDPGSVWVDDGDTVRIRWPDAPAERVRILGIDAPEVANRRDPGRKAQEYGDAARDFARRAILGATRLELLRAPRPDRYGRTLGYLFLDGENYSVLAVEAHMAESTVGRFGDEGFPREAAEVQAAARRAGPPPFESPKAFRDREAARKAG